MQSAQQHGVGLDENMQYMEDLAPVKAGSVPGWFPAATQAVAPDNNYRPLQAESSIEAETLRSFMQSHRSAPEPAAIRDFGGPRARKHRAVAAARSRPRHAAAYVAIGFLAALVGVAAGYGTSRYNDITASLGQPAAVLAPIAATKVAAPSLGNATTVSKKTIATATLNVSDVSGDADSVIPLLLHAQPSEASQSLSLRISGMPEAAYLTAGEKNQDATWKLAAADIKDVGIVVPPGSSPKFDLAIAAVDVKTSELAAPIKEITVTIAEPVGEVTVASTAPEPVVAKPAAVKPKRKAQPAPEPPEPKPQVSAEAMKLMANGDILLKSGDLVKARQFYELAFTQGLSEAAIGVGRTFDPNVYAELKVQGMTPDPIRAMEWYMRASAAGAPGASAAIATLKQTPPPHP